MMSKIIVAIALVALATGTSAHLSWRSCGSSEFTKSIEEVRVERCSQFLGPCRIPAGYNFLFALEYKQSGKQMDDPLVRIEFDGGNVIEEKGDHVLLDAHAKVGDRQQIWMQVPMPSLQAGKDVTMKVTARNSADEVEDTSACVEVSIRAM